MASRYLSTEIFIFATSLFQVKGAAIPSSKKDRGRVAACGGPTEGFVKEVVDGPIIDIAGTIDKEGLINGSALDRAMGDMPLIESIEVAGETPSEASDRRFRGYSQIST